MKANDNLTQAMKNIELMGDSLALLKTTYEQLVEKAYKDVRREDLPKFQEFLQDSNDLISKAPSVSHFELNNLTENLKSKYGIGVNKE
jgi:galactokinase